MSKQLLVTFFSWLLTSQVMAQYDLYVSVFEGGTLKETVEAIADDAMHTVRSMKVNGPVNGTDMMFIRELAGVRELETPTEGQLRVLDMTNAHVVESAEVYLSMYGVDFTTKENHFGSGFLYNCKQLEEVHLPMEIVSIDTLALALCSSLKEVMIPAEVEKIGFGAFYGCAAISSLDVPDMVTEIEEGAFQNMMALEELFLGNAVTTLDHNAILGDYRLQGITLGEGFRDFNPALFNHSPALANINVVPGNPHFSSLDGVLYSSGADSLLAFPPAFQSGEFQIPEGVSHVAPYAFCMAAELKSVAMPASLLVVDTMAFYGCQSLSEVRLNEGLRKLRFGAFAYFMDEESSLPTLSIPSTVDEIEGGTFLFQTASLSVSEQNGHYMTTEWGMLCSKDTTVICHVPCNAAQAELPLCADSVAPYAFAGAAMPSIYLPDGVRAVGNGAFMGAKSFQITLGKGIERLGDMLVEGCTLLNALYCFASPDDEHIAPAAFSDNGGNVARQCELFVLPGKRAEFMQKRGFSDAEGKSFFSGISEMDDADHMEMPKGDVLSGTTLYDWSGKRVPPSHAGARIVELPDGKGIKVIGK